MLTKSEKDYFEFLFKLAPKFKLVPFVWENNHLIYHNTKPRILLIVFVYFTILWKLIFFATQAGRQFQNKEEGRGFLTCFVLLMSLGAYSLTTTLEFFAVELVHLNNNIMNVSKTYGYFFLIRSKFGSN